MAGPLEGIRILEWAMFHNGPAAGYLLGDLGAEIIKIEEPERGDASRGIRSMYDLAIRLPQGGNVQFETANRNKKSVTINLKSEKGRAVFYRLVERSDVFFTNFRKGVAKKLGVDYETLSRYNPKLIYAINSTYGTRGRWKEKRGFDPVAQAFSGAMFAFAPQEETMPSWAMGAMFDQTGATLLAYGILAALVARERTGVGQELEGSLLGAGVHLQALQVNAQLWIGQPMQRHSRTHPRNVMTNHYRCADGKWMLLVEPQSDRFWHDFCQVLGIQELEEDPRFHNAEARGQNQEELLPILERVFATRTRDEWVEAFQPYDFGYSPIHDFGEAFTDPQVLENEYVVEVEHPTLGKTKTVGFPVRFSKTPASIRSTAPQLGQHTEEVLLEVGGYSWEEIQELREQGAF